MPAEWLLLLIVPPDERIVPRHSLRNSTAAAWFSASVSPRSPRWRLASAPTPRFSRWPMRRSCSHAARGRSRKLGRRSSGRLMVAARLLRMDDAHRPSSAVPPAASGQRPDQRDGRQRDRADRLRHRVAELFHRARCGRPSAWPAARRGRRWWAAAGLAVVIDREWWQTRLHADPAVVGRTIHVSGAPATIVGIAEDGFRGTSLTRMPKLYLPLTSAARLLRSQAVQRARRAREPRYFVWLTAAARLQPGVSRPPPRPPR